jgi:hypothetical protein
MPQDQELIKSNQKDHHLEQKSEGLNASNLMEHLVQDQEHTRQNTETRMEIK